MTENPVVIIGAGIGGLSAALALAHLGRPVKVLERAPELHEVGAGIQLTPNAVRALQRLGLDVGPAQACVEPEIIEVHSGLSGKVITAMPVREAAAQHWKNKWYMVHRADLLNALIAETRKYPQIDILTGWPVGRIAHADGGMTLTHADDDSRALIADALIGADGLWSRARRALGDVALPRPSQKTAWRAILPIEQVPAAFHGRKGGLWVGPGTHLTQYPIRGGELMNIVAIIADDWDGEGWSTPGDAKDVREAFSHWCDCARELLSLPQHWMRWPLVDRPAWYGPGEGKATLLGDAAHPMVPFLAQGAAAAIEDAAILGRETAATPDDLAGAFRRYEAERQPRTRRIQDEARQNGDIYALSGMMAIARDTVMRLRGGDQLLRRYDWIYSWEP